MQSKASINKRQENFRGTITVLLKAFLRRKNHPLMHFRPCHALPPLHNYDLDLIAQVFILDQQWKRFHDFNRMTFRTSKQAKWLDLLGQFFIPTKHTVTVDRRVTKWHLRIVVLFLYLSWRVMFLGINLRDCWPLKDGSESHICDWKQTIPDYHGYNFLITEWWLLEKGDDYPYVSFFDTYGLVFQLHSNQDGFLGIILFSLQTGSSKADCRENGAPLSSLLDIFGLKVSCRFKPRQGLMKPSKVIKWGKS